MVDFETAAPVDRVSGKQLQERTRYHGGSDIIGNSDNNQITELYPEKKGGKKKPKKKPPVERQEEVIPPKRGDTPTTQEPVIRENVPDTQFKIQKSLSGHNDQIKEYVRVGSGRTLLFLPSWVKSDGQLPGRKNSMQPGERFT